MSQVSPQSNQEKKALVQDYFSRTASGYVSSTALRSSSDLKRLVEMGEWQAQHHALDIATGGGHTVLAVAPYVARMTKRKTVKGVALIVTQRNE